MYSRNTLSLIVTTHNNVRAFHFEMASIAQKQVMNVLYKKAIQSLDKQVEGASDLKIQKMIYICSVIGCDLQIWMDQSLQTWKPMALDTVKKTGL